ncbi:class II aldolase/adducin family protein [Halobellus captivus]|uniref:class II aldolase/adducin family protein n=1 Tax=Halobellus captivus TaxID=2592614 RepID=UPI0011A266B3|nr:class II aldolase/adducin family protein [Halobellus captivus]
MSQSLTEQLVTANRIVANEGIISGFGHVSVRDPDSDTVLISQSRSPAFVTKDDILELSLDGEVLRGDDRSPYLENVIHRAIYRARPDVNAVVHHHAAPIIPFAVTDVNIRPAYHLGMLFHDGVPKFDDYDPDYGWLVVTEDEGARMAENLGDHRAQLLVGHGANNVGSSLKEALVTTYHFVTNAQYQLSAMGLGELTFAADDEEMARSTVEDVMLSDLVVDRLWNYLRDRLPDS